MKSDAGTPPPPKFVVAVFNPASGTGDPQARRRALEAALRQEGVRAEIRDTSPGASATELARAAVAEGVQRVLACGGDGTVMEVAAALVGQPVALGIVPGGTGNLLATNLEIPSSLPGAVRVALRGRIRQIDVGRSGEDVMVMMAGIGWDAQMIRDADRELKGRFGFLAYFWAALRHLGRPPVRFRIRLDDDRPISRRAKTVLVANFGRITGGLPVVPRADPSDGYLDVAILTAETLPGFAGLCASALLRRLERDPRIQYYRVRRVRITAGHPQPIQFDGNDRGATRVLELEVAPAALRVMVP